MTTIDAAAASIGECWPLQCRSERERTSEVNKNFNVRERAKRVAAAVGTAAAVAGGSAFAGGGGGFESSAITSAITTHVGIASGIIGAFILGVWTLRSLGLLKRS